MRRAAATTSSVATTASVVRTQYVHGGHTADHAGGGDAEAVGC